jgi:DNA-binding NarL/FixJ family response regulator
MKSVAKRIVCIEDDHETASLIAEDLSDRGYEVRVAHDGGAGLRMLLEQPPDLILADINMPVMSGFEVLEQLTANEPHFANIPFVFLTALADRDNELKGWRLGADDYVTKPVDFEVLAALISARLARVGRTEAAHTEQSASTEVAPTEPAPAEAGTKGVMLAKREIETLTWAARGKTSAEIAQILGLSKRTVDFHIENARTKLGVATRTQAVAKAATGQLISP